MKKIMIIDGGPRKTFNTASMLQKFAEGATSVSSEIEVKTVRLYGLDYKGQKHIQTMQYFFLPFYPVLRLLGQANNMREISLSQLALVRHGYEKFAISPKDISSLAKLFEKSI
jgi:hypothetical protein